MSANGTMFGTEVCFLCSRPKKPTPIKAVLYNIMSKYILDKEPCNSCLKNMKEGVILVKAITEDGKPTPVGGYIVVKEQSLLKFGFSPTIVSKIIRDRVAFIDPDSWVEFGLEALAK